MALLSLDTVPTVPPREVITDQPVRLVLVGGFLGAGKTTALVALAREFVRRGLRVGIITNDQAAHLVDTATVRQAGYAVSEVAGGCFCCRFTDLVDATQQIISEIQPDILLCEPVGSCTDMAATVIAPLRRFYPHQFQIAPFTVLVDPAHVRELVLGEARSLLASEAAYIFTKQLEEADEIVLN
jgi:G3E family GTPase